MAARIDGWGGSPERDPFFPIGLRTFQAWRWGLKQGIREGRVPGPTETQVGGPLGVSPSLGQKKLT